MKCRPRLIALACSMIFAGAAAAADQEIYDGHFPKPGGEDVFRNICQGCHMPNAMGATGAGTYPRLAGNQHLEEASYPVTMVLFGQKAMPPFGRHLNDAQIANVVNYVRSHFGNKYTDMVTPADVAKIRATEKIDDEGNIVKHPG
jgi:mono/diheme cytochrome c family protein